MQETECSGVLESRPQHPADCSRWKIVIKALSGLMPVDSLKLSISVMTYCVLHAPPCCGQAASHSARHIKVRGHVGIRMVEGEQLEARPCLWADKKTHCLCFHCSHLPTGLLSSWLAQSVGSPVVIGLGG